MHDPAAIERALPWARKLRDYCRLTVEGVERVPEGPCVLVANHTGWAGLDFVNLYLTVYEATGRVPRIAAHPTYFQARWLREFTERFGAYEVSVATSTKILDEKGIVTFFPEAEEGNFKPVWKRYQLQEFKTGFARVALASLAPVVPVVIVGGEDASPSLGKLHVKHDLGVVPIPLPLSLLPLPAKWRIAFLPPVDPGKYLDQDSPDKDHAEDMARDVRRTMQAALDEQVARRGHAFF